MFYITETLKCIFIFLLIHVSRTVVKITKFTNSSTVHALRSLHKNRTKNHSNIKTYILSHTQRYELNDTILIAQWYE
jgi:hypothetical protein